MTRRSMWVSGVALGALLSACSSTTDTGVDAVGTGTLKVLGRVADGLNAPAVAASVVVTPYAGSCVGTPITMISMITDASGRYNGSFATNGAFRGCIQVVVNAGSGDSFPRVTTRRDNLIIARPSADSVTVNVIVVRIQ